jgi:hypothetical protein
MFVNSSQAPVADDRDASFLAASLPNDSELSSVLRSQRAIAANILIMRTFAQLRRTQATPATP